MNIIIVDDDTLVTEALKTILESSGKVTVTATGSDGTDAVRLYKEFKPDILLTDIQKKYYPLTIPQKYFFSQLFSMMNI